MKLLEKIVLEVADCWQCPFRSVLTCKLTEIDIEPCGLTTSRPDWCPLDESNYQIEAVDRDDDPAEG